MAIWNEHRNKFISMIEEAEKNPERMKELKEYLSFNKVYGTIIMPPKKRWVNKWFGLRKVLEEYENQYFIGTNGVITKCVDIGNQDIN